MSSHSQPFSPLDYESALTALCLELAALPEIDARALDRAVRRHPKGRGRSFSKGEIILGARALAPLRGWKLDPELLATRLRRKPVRTLSGVAPVTVLTEPYPCPGRCVFCPSDVRMPKSYLSSEPGAQRAAQNRFDPYRQCWARLRALHENGHRVDKVELLVLGGTWSSYPEGYRLWFLERCLSACNEFEPGRREPPGRLRSPDFAALEPGPGGYDRTVTELARGVEAPSRIARAIGPVWEALQRAQRVNETASVRCVGLVLETRPDRVNEAEVESLRRMGATKVQLGIQSLDDAILSRNRRGHDVAASRRASELLRRAGFKLHFHWMPNLVGASPDSDRRDFVRLFDDPALRPDELKIYPCSVVESAELAEIWRQGGWRPYRHRDLVELLADCLLQVPSYCRVSRVVRDIPSTEILDGNRRTNLRQDVDAELRKRGRLPQEIRAREIRGRPFDPAELRFETLGYDSSSTGERFLQGITGEGGLAGFLRLSLPHRSSFLPELGRAAVVRELHVYGEATRLGERTGRGAQHRGLGGTLLERAARIARRAGYPELAVISAVGTREYYRRKGFRDRGAYQLLELERDPGGVAGEDPVAASGL